MMSAKVGVAFASALLVVGGCSNPDGTTTANDQGASDATPLVLHTLTGLFTLDAAELDTPGWATCSGTWGFDDFGPGMQVTIRDDYSIVVANTVTHSMAESQKDEFPQEYAEWQNLPDHLCTVMFEVQVSDFPQYEVEIGTRGAATVTREKLEQSNWTIRLSL